MEWSACAKSPASHPDELHDTFNKLYDFANHSLKRTKNWVQGAFKESKYVHIKYPIIVLQGDLYETFEDHVGPKLRKCEHVVFEFNRYDENSSALLIDIVTEAYFEKLLDAIQEDGKSLKKVYSRSIKAKEADEDLPF